tara:strand:+ start:844 stop:3837 length:2994 start_codon:yes stop_codon:yes gene_type:complete
MKNYFIILLSALSFLVAEDIVVSISSTDDIAGIQYGFTGGGSFSYNPDLTPGPNQTGDTAPYIFNILNVLPNGFTLMADTNQGYLPSTNGIAQTFVTYQNTGGSNVCVDASTLIVSDRAGNTLTYATTDPNNCLLITVSNACDDVDNDGICDDVDGCVGTPDCAGECNGSALDLGCGCGVAGPSGCDNACGSTAENDACGVCGGDGSSCAADYTVLAGNLYYNPSSLAISLGETVEWVNEGGFHDVVVTSGPELFSLSACIGPCIIGDYTFTVPGIYDYICSIGNHAAGGMVASITVGSGGCTDENACNYNASADFSDNSCVFADLDECESCLNGSVVTNDSDNDGICNDLDGCDGTVDACGVCAGDGSSCQDIFCTDLPENDNTLYVDVNGIVYYNFTSTLAGFQFNLVGSSMSSASGGAAANAGFIVSAGNSTAVGLSFTGAEILPGSGILTELNGLSGIPTGLSNIILSSPVINGIVNEFVDSTETFVCQAAECTVDLDNDGICDDVDDCVGAVDSCGVCNGPGATQDCGCSGIPQGACNCDGDTLDAVGVCGGSCALDADEDDVCDDVDDCVGAVDSCGVCNGNGPSYNCGENGDLVCSDTDCPTTGGVIVDTNLSAGWNWISTNVLSSDMNLGVLFSSVEGDDFIKSQTGFSTYYDLPGFSGWFGDITNVEIGKGYKLNLQNSYNWTYTGMGVSSSDYPISLYSGWNWIGYLPSSDLDINTALTFEAQDGDYIKGQTGFSTYYDLTGFTQWFGQLNTLSPLNAYLIKVQSDVVFTYPEGISRALDYNFDLNPTFDYGEFEFNGAITASINASDIDVSSNDFLIAYDNYGQVRGKVNPIYFPPTNEYIFMLMVYGNKNDETLSFEYYNQDANRSYLLNEMINFESDMIIGDGLNPLNFNMNNIEEVSVLSISKAYPNPFNPSTNLDYSIMNSGHVEITVFDVTGRKVSILENSFKNAGDYNIVWNAQNNTSGIYYIQILAGNELKTQKVVLLK